MKNIWLTEDKNGGKKGNKEQKGHEMVRWYL